MYIPGRWRVKDAHHTETEQQEQQPMEFGLNRTLFLTTLCNLFTWQTSPKWPWSRSFYKRFLPNYTHKKNMFAQVKVPFRSGKGSSIQRNSSPSFPPGALQLQEWIHKGHELCSAEALDLAERKKKQTAAWHNQSTLNKQKSLQHCPCFFSTFTWKKWFAEAFRPLWKSWHPLVQGQAAQPPPWIQTVE